MTRLDRVFDLIEKYDSTVYLLINDADYWLVAESRLEQLREEKAKLFEELREHGCRRAK